MSYTRQFIIGNLDPVSGLTLLSPLVSSTPATPIAWGTTTNPLGDGQSQILAPVNFSTGTGCFSVFQLPSVAQVYVREFNYYKINKISLSYKPRMTGATNQAPYALHAAVSNNTPRMIIATDHNGSQPLTSEDDALRFQNHRTLEMYRMQRHVLKPSSLVAVSQTDGGVVSLSPGQVEWNKWQTTELGPTTTTPTTLYTGLRTLFECPFDPTTVAQFPPIDIYATFSMSLKEHVE